MGYEFVRPAHYSQEQAKRAIRVAEEEIERLRKISERQSAMLATAIKEKNDSQEKLNKADFERSAFYQNRFEQTRLDLAKANELIGDIKTSARAFFRAVGVL